MIVDIANIHQLACVTQDWLLQMAWHEVGTSGLFY